MADKKQPGATLEQAKLIQIYLKAEQDLTNAISYKRSRDYVDYGEMAALKRVQTILQGMVDDSWEYVPKMVESVFTKNVVKETGYENAFALTAAQTNVVGLIVENMMAEIIEAAGTTKNNIQAAYKEAEENVRKIQAEAIPAQPIIGRLNIDEYRTAALEAVAMGESTGGGMPTAQDEFLTIMSQKGIVAFTDKSGRNWSLSNYANMVVRTTSRQSANASVLYADDHDLWQISSHAAPCRLCATFQGRVYSKSGKNPNYPPLHMAFGKINKNGPDDLMNTYLNIHPSCLHVLIKYSEEGQTDDEIEEIRKKSSFTENPASVDPRTQAERDAYRNKVEGRRKYLQAYKEWQQMKTVLGKGFPKSPQTFIKNKAQKNPKYNEWKKLYKEKIKAAP